MNITINTSLTRLYTGGRGDRQVVYFTLTDDAAVLYRMVDDLPAGIDAQAYLDANIERELLFVRKAEYPQRPVLTPIEGQTELQAFEAWITEESPIKTAWIDRWNDTDAAMALSIEDNIPSWAQVNTAITNIANLTDAKEFIRKLARVVYWNIKGTEV